MICLASLLINEHTNIHGGGGGILGTCASLFILTVSSHRLWLYHYEATTHTKMKASLRHAFQALTLSVPIFLPPRYAVCNNSPSETLAEQSLEEKKGILLTLTQTYLILKSFLKYSEQKEVEKKRGAVGVNGKRKGEEIRGG